jgi:hypothetical protein
MRPGRGRTALALAIALAPGPWARAQGGVPDVAVGARAIDEAPRVEAPIAEVTVFSDRARVRRRGRAKITSEKSGPVLQLVRLPDLPGAVFLDTVRVAAVGARVLRVEAAVSERERVAIERASKLLDELDAVSDRLAEADDRRALDDWELGLLGRLIPEPPVRESEREGRKNLSLDVASWAKALDFIGQRAGDARARQARLVDEQRELAQRRDRLRADLTALDRGGFSQRAVEVVALLEAPRAGGTAEIQLEYFIPGARWSPAYDLHFAPKRGELRLETAAVVSQATGEDWDQAALLFSTAIPGRGIDLPELSTWTVGERNELILQPRARPVPVAAPVPGAAPSSVSPAASDRDQLDADIDLLRRRIAMASVAETSRDKNAGPSGRIGYEASEMQRKAPAPPPPPLESALVTTMSAPAMARVSRRAHHDEDSEGSAEESEAPPRRRSYAQEEQRHRTSYRAAWSDTVSVAQSLGGTASSSRAVRVPLALIDTPPSGPALTDPRLPAVSAGGLDYVYPAPKPATVPGSGKELRVPLASQLFRTAAFHEATPALASTAYLRARARNDGLRPLLRGPATIFGDGELVGVGELQTTGPGGDIDFPLGADQDVRLVRQVVPSTRTTGLFIKSDETTYDVQIQIGNYKKQAVTVDVRDQLPRSVADKVDVQLVDAQPAAAAPPDADGVIRWRVDVPAGATRTVRLVYRITRPKDWVLYQR